MNDLYMWQSNWNDFIEYVLSDGRTIHEIEQPGGGRRYVWSDRVDDAYDHMSENDAEWTEIQDTDEIQRIIDAAGPEPRPITPHKGGRTKRIDLRFTELELATLDEARGKMSRSDYIASMLPEPNSDKTISLLDSAGQFAPDGWGEWEDIESQSVDEIVETCLDMLREDLFSDGWNAADIAHWRVERESTERNIISYWLEMNQPEADDDDD